MSDVTDIGRTRNIRRYTVKWDGNIYNKIRTSGSMKLITVLTILAVIASAATVLFVLHAETDSSSAEVNESGWCGPDAY